MEQEGRPANKALSIASQASPELANPDRSGSFHSTLGRLLACSDMGELLLVIPAYGNKQPSALRVMEPWGHGDGGRGLCNVGVALAVCREEHGRVDVNVVEYVLVRNLLKYRLSSTLAGD